MRSRINNGITKGPYGLKFHNAEFYHINTTTPISITSHWSGLEESGIRRFILLTLWQSLKLIKISPAIKTKTKGNYDKM